MFGWGKQAQEKREQEELAEREYLQQLSEKEILIELMIELKRVDKKLDRIRSTVISHSN